jgi:hypothetical protein
MEGAPTLPLDGGTDERPRGATGRLFATGRLYGIGLLDLTLEDTLPASLALLGYLGGLLFASGVCRSVQKRPPAQRHRRGLAHAPVHSHDSTVHSHDSTANQGSHDIRRVCE